jgi:hypothetical protein
VNVTPGVIPFVKPFTWSYSRLKNYEACPKRHYAIDIAKEFKEEESEQLKWGNLVHKALDLAVGKDKPLPEGMKGYQKIVDNIRSSPGKVITEQQLAITSDFAPTGYFDRNVWYRAKIDVTIIMEPVAMVIDYKTGKILEDSVQLGLAAATIFNHYPTVQKIRSRFLWLADDCKTDNDFERKDMPAFWSSIWPRIEALKHAHETTTYPAIPNRLCRNWCPVTSCPHHGR